MTGPIPDSDHERLAAFLRAVPGPADNALPLTPLCTRSGLDPATARTVLALARVLGGEIVTLRGDPGDETVRASTAVGWYFLKSLAEYAADGFSLFGGWERPSVGRQDGNPPDLPSGPRLLYLMEHRRLKLDANAPCLREVQVAQVIIKAHGRRPGQDLYLAQYDKRAQDFQLTGGTLHRSDADLHETAIRELEEELPGFRFDPQRDILRSLGRVQVPQVSRTYGVATRYDIEIFHLRTDRGDIPAPPTARWFTESELLATDRGRTSVNMTALRAVGERVPGGLNHIPASVSERRGRRLTGANLWEITGVVLGVLGIAVSVLFYFLT